MPSFSVSEAIVSAAHVSNSERSSEGAMPEIQPLTVPVMVWRFMPENLPNSSLRLPITCGIRIVIASASSPRTIANTRITLMAFLRPGFFI